MSIYLRIRRNKVTYFVHCEPTDTAAAFKVKLAAMMGRPKEGCKEQLRLQVEAAGKPGTYAVLEDNAQLEQVGLKNDDLVYLTYLIDGPGGPDGNYEQVHVEQFEPLSGGADEMEVDAKGKGGQ